MRAKDLKLRKLGDSHMLVDTVADNIDLTQVLTLNSVAAWLWEEARRQGDFTAESLTAELCKKYDVEHDEALRDVEEQLAQWKEYGILTIND
jgi:hypothetical protein